MKLALTMFTLTGGLMAQQQIGLTPAPRIGAATPIPASAAEKAPPSITITDMERYSVIESSNGGKVYLYRHDLTKPTIKLVSQSRQKGDESFGDGADVYVYTYAISNDKTALESINQVSFLLALDEPALIWYTPKGVAPGETQTFSITSQYPPGSRKVSIVNVDDIKEAAYLAQFPEPDQETVDAYHAGMATLRPEQADPTEFDVIGPVAPPKEDEPASE